MKEKQKRKRKSHRGIEPGPPEWKPSEVAIRPRSLTFQLQKILRILNQIWIIPDPFPFHIPYSAWREFPLTFCVLSIHPKGPYSAEKPSIFKIGYVKQVCLSRVLGVKWCIRATLVYKVSLANWGQKYWGKYRRNQQFCFDTDSAVFLHVFQWYLNKIKCNLGTRLSF